MDGLLILLGACIVGTLGMMAYVIRTRQWPYLVPAILALLTGISMFVANETTVDWPYWVGSAGVIVTSITLMGITVWQQKHSPPRS